MKGFDEQLLAAFVAGVRHGKQFRSGLTGEPMANPISNEEWDELVAAFREWRPEAALSRGPTFADAENP